MSSEEPTFRERVDAAVEHEKRRVRREALLANWIIFFVLTPILWVMATNGGGYLLPLFLMACGWLATLLMQTAAFLYDTAGRERQVRERIVQRELLAEQLRRIEAEEREKPKHGERLAISDDGELVPVVEDENSARLAKQ